MTDEYCVSGREDLLSGLRAVRAALTSREIDVYAARRLAQEPRTLQYLARELGVTRERVRQIESAAQKVLERPELQQTLTSSAHALVAELGPLTTLERLRTVTEALLGGSAEPIPSWYPTLAILSAGYRVRGNWLIVEELRSRLLAPLLDDLVFGPVSLDEITTRAAAENVRQPALLEWLFDTEPVARVDRHLVSWRGSMGDKAVRLLEVKGRPMTVDALFSEAGGKNRSSFVQRLQCDDRIQRIGVSTYGLASWGGSTYTTISEAIAAILVARRGEIPLIELVDALSNQFGVAGGSVRAYANGHRFETLSTGIVRLRHTPRSIGSPVHTRGCYLHPDGWTLRIDVDRDVLRGSGRPIPDAFAAILGLRPLETTAVESSAGVVTAGWNDLVASFGSLRAVAEQLDAADGDVMFCTALRQREARFFVVHRLEIEASAGLSRFLLDIGLRPEGIHEHVTAVCDALAVLETGNARLSGLRRRLRLRGEANLLNLIAG